MFRSDLFITLPFRVAATPRHLANTVQLGRLYATRRFLLSLPLQLRGSIWRDQALLVGATITSVSDATERSASALEEALR